MYWCADCEKEFEKPVKRAVLSGEFWGAPFTEYGDTCPYCKSDNISLIVNYCHICDKAICLGDTCYEIADGTLACENCVTKREA